MTDTSDYPILVVDDDEPIIRNIRRILKRKGFNRVVSALTVEQGLKLLETAQTPFFLILSDQRMPGISGSEFLARSISISPDSRRMLMTGYSDFDAIVDAINQGQIHQFIAKPWNNDDLLLRISGELDIYRHQQDHKQIFRLTQQQNTKLFDLAARQKKSLLLYAGQIKDKNDRITVLFDDLKQARLHAAHREIFPGLNELLSRTLTITPRNLSQAFEISRKQIVSLMTAIAVRHNIPLPADPAALPDGDVIGLADDIFGLIDQVIETAIQAAESELCRIGSDAGARVPVDSYTEVPDPGQLALNEGFITDEQLKQAREELTFRELQSPAGQTIDTVLQSLGFLDRRNLSRVFARMTLIETRLMDQEFAQILLKQKRITPRDIDRARCKQLALFEDTGATLLLGDILVASGLISEAVKDEIIAGQDRHRERTRRPEFSAQITSSQKSYIDLQVSDDGMEAWIRIPRAGDRHISHIKEMIRKKGIRFGIVPDETLREFMEKCTDPREKLVVARGTTAGAGTPAVILYHFNTEQNVAGVVQEDGSIDFRSRGEAPFVTEGQLLAEKKPVENSVPGQDIFGKTLRPDDVMAPPPAAGNRGHRIRRRAVPLCRHPGPARHLCQRHDIRSGSICHQRRCGLQDR